MHDLLENHCAACGFTMKGLGLARAAAERACRMCGLPLETRPNLSVSRRLPDGMPLLMGAFAASIDANPLLAAEQPPVPGFARSHRAPRRRPAPFGAPSPGALASSAERSACVGT